MTLESVVSGYVRAQDEKRKKASEVANKIADKWERNFKTEQAKTEADRADRDLKIRKQQAETAAGYEKTAALREADTAKKQERADKVAEIKAASQSAHWQNLDKLKDPEAVRAQIMKQAGEYIKAGEPPAQAVQRAIQDVHEVQDAITPLNGSAAPSAGAGTLGAMLGLAPIGPQGLDKSPMAQVAPGQGDLSGRGAPTPKALMDQLTAKARQDKIAADTKKTQEQTRIMKMDADATKQLIKSRSTLTEAQAEKVRAEAKLVPFKIEEITAHAVQLRASARAALENADTSRDRESRLRAEGDLRTDPNSLTARKNLSALIGSTRDRAIRLNEEVMKNVKAMANLDLQMESLKARKGSDKKTGAEDSEINTLVGAKAGYAEQLKDLTSKYNEANAEYLNTLKTATDHKVSVPTTPSGAPDRKAAAGNQRAVSEAARKARRQASIPPAPVLPPGTLQAPPGSLSPRRGGSPIPHFPFTQHAPRKAETPKKPLARKTPAKKDLGHMSVSELRKLEQEMKGAH